MKILRAEHLGMCFGVRDAIQFAKEEVQQGPFTILGQLAHNELVNRALESEGIQICSKLEEIQHTKVMITAHGASLKKISTLKNLGYQVIEATCPLVKNAHQALFSLVNAGYFPIIIGKAGHVEVLGMTEDLSEYEVIFDESDLKRLPHVPKMGVVSQTTQPLERIRILLEALKKNFPTTEIKFVDTVCRPTKERQSAAVRLAQQSEIVLVIGGINSNNTKELVSTCRRYCKSVYQIQSIADIQKTWFSGVEVVGITAGTSTPEEVILTVEKYLTCLSQEENDFQSDSSCVIPSSGITTTYS